VGKRKKERKKEKKEKKKGGGEEENKLFGVSSYKALNPIEGFTFMTSPNPSPKCLSKACCPNTFTWLSHMNEQGREQCRYPVHDSI
jgi:hypothetical protein